jgi:tetratricopeptide (TPR) repeat protein
MSGPDPLQLAATFVEKADDARGRDEDELAWGWLQKAMALYRAQKDDRGVATTGRRLAALQARRGDLRSALVQAEEARDAAERSWSREDMAAIEYVIGAVRCQLGEVEVGVRRLHQSVDLWGALGRVDGQLRAWRRIAHAQAVDGDLDAGLSAWTRCLTVYRHKFDLVGEADIHTEAARACANAGRPDLAIHHALAALGRHRHLDHPHTAADLSLMIDIRGQLGGAAFAELLERHLDADATAIVIGLIDAEDARLSPTPPDPIADLSEAEAALLSSPEEPWEPLGSSDIVVEWEEDPMPQTDHRPLELVTIFGRVIVALVVLLLILLLLAAARTALSG